MPTDLERIEEKHKPFTEDSCLDPECSECVKGEAVTHPCDVVKLARALEGNIRRGHRPECTTRMVGKDDLSFCDCGYAEAEHVLREVAGGDDD